MGSQQLKPLKARLTIEQQQRRDDRIAARVASRNLVNNVNILGTVTMAHLRRGFWGRLKWLVLGR